MAAELAAQLGEVVVVDAAAFKEDALLQQHLDVLMVLGHGVGKVFPAGNRLAQKGHRLPVKIVEDGLRLIQNRQIPVDAHRVQAPVQPLDVPLQVLLDLHARLALLGSHLLLQQGDQLLRTIIKHLPRRRDGHPLHRVLAALGVHLEGGHGVDAVVPELDAHRLGAVGREDVQNAAAPRKLADALHLVAVLVAHRHQLLDNLLLVVAAVLVDLQDGGSELLLGDGALAGRLGRGDHHPRLPAQQGAQGPQPLVFKLAGRPVDVQQHIVPGREVQHPLPQQGVEVGRKADGGALVRHNHQRRALQLVDQRGDDVGLVRGGGSGQRDRHPALLDCLLELAVLHHAVQQTKKLFHRDSPTFLYRSVSVLL